MTKDFENTLTLSQICQKYQNTFLNNEVFVMLKLFDESETFEEFFKKLCMKCDILNYCGIDFIKNEAKWCFEDLRKWLYTQGKKMSIDSSLYGDNEKEMFLNGLSNLKEVFEYGMKIGEKETIKRMKEFISKENWK